MSRVGTNLATGWFGVRIAAMFGKADPASEHGRARARHRAIALTSIASALSRGVNILTVLISVPLTLNYLGSERYGMWMTLSSLSVILSLTDIGIGNSILNVLARACGHDDSEALRRAIASGYGAMIGITLALAALLAIAFPFIDWPGLFGVTSTVAMDEAAPAAALFLAALVLTTPFTLVYRVQLGLQQGFRASLWQAAASVLALLVLMAAIALKASLPVLVLALAGTPVVVGLAATLDFLVRTRSDLRPSLAAFDAATVRHLARQGGLFLILQICAALLFQTNALIIAQLLGPDQVTNFAVPERMFSIITTLLLLVFVPLWPAYGEALAREDNDWVRKAFRRSLLIAVGTAAAFSLILALVAQPLLRLWVGDAVYVPAALIAGFAVWKVIEAAGHAIAMFLNGTGQIGVQAGAAVVTTALSFGMRIWGGQHFGIAGVQWGTIAAYCLCTLPVAAWATRRGLRRIGQAGMKPAYAAGSLAEAAS